MNITEPAIEAPESNGGIVRTREKARTDRTKIIAGALIAAMTLFAGGGAAGTILSRPVVKTGSDLDDVRAAIRLELEPLTRRIIELETRVTISESQVKAMNGEFRARVEQVAVDAKKTSEDVAFIRGLLERSKP